MINDLKQAHFHYQFGARILRLIFHALNSSLQNSNHKQQKTNT